MIFVRIVVVLLAVSIGSNKVFADNFVLTEDAIKNFYSNLLDAQIAGGSYVLSFHEKHFHTDLSLILSLQRIVKGREMPKTFLDHDKRTFMEAIKKNDKVINHIAGDHEIIKFSIDEGGRSANVQDILTSNFLVQVDKVAKPFRGVEKMECRSRLVLSNNNVIQILSSKCDVYVTMQ